jgi:hypothetical protein
MGEQLPSGILLFLAFVLFLAAVFVFFSGGEGVNAPSAVLGIALVGLGGTFVWLVGGGQEANRPETIAHIEPENTVEPATEGTTSASRRTGQSQDATADTYANYCIDKQFAEATQNLSPPQATGYETGVINEAVARGVDPRTVLAERGFPC